MNNLLREYLKLALSEPKAIGDSIVAASRGRLRLSGSKRGALRLAPVAAGDVIDDKTLMSFFEAAGSKDTKIITPKSPGSASSKFNTYELKVGGEIVKVVIGQGRNLGQSFEDDVNTEVGQALSGGKISGRIQQLFDAIGIKASQVASVEQASRKRVKRPLTAELKPVGPEISDMTLVMKKGQPIYISIKNVSGDTFANAGCSGMFEVKEGKDGVVVTSKAHPLDDFVSALGINKKAAAKGYTNYANGIKQLPKGKGSPDLDKVRDYLVAAYGYGYWYAREEGSGFHVIDMTTAKAVREHVGEVTDVQVRYPGVSKQITCVINTSGEGGRYIVEIRNSHGGIDPNEIKVKVG
jgi:hypothetical protein